MKNILIKTLLIIFVITFIPIYSYSESELDARNYITAGYMQSKYGNHEDAITNYTRAINIGGFDNLADVYVMRGIEKNSIGDNNGAIQDCSSAISLSPKHSFAYMSRGCLYAEQKNYKKAMNDLNKAIENKTNYAYAFYKRGMIKAQMKDNIGALQDLTNAINMEQNPEIYMVRATVRNDLKDYQGAIDDYSNAIKIIKNSYIPYSLRASAYIRVGKYENAVKDYTKSLRLKPEYPESYLGRGIARIKLKQYKDAEKDLNKAKEIYLKNENMTGYQKTAEVLNILESEK